MSSTSQAAIRAALLDCGVSVGAADVFAETIAAHATSAPVAPEPPSVPPDPGGIGRDSGTVYERSTLATMSPEAIDQARRDGLLDHLLRGDR